MEVRIGGGLKLRAGDADEMGAIIESVFNRMVLFETSINSYHGFLKPITSPLDIHRNSIAMYQYTIEESKNVRSYNTRWRKVEGEKFSVFEKKRKLLAGVTRRLASKLEVISRRLDVH